MEHNHTTETPQKHHRNTTKIIEIIEAYKKSLIEWKNKHSGEGE